MLDPMGKHISSVISPSSSVVSMTSKRNASMVRVAIFVIVFHWSFLLFGVCRSRRPPRGDPASSSVPEWLATVPSRTLTSDQLTLVYSNVFFNGPLALLLAFIGCQLPLLPPSVASGTAQVLLGCVTVDAALWALHAASHAPVSTPASILSSYGRRAQKRFAELHLEHHKLGCIRTTLGGFYGDHLEHFLWTLVAGIAGRAAVGSWVTAATLTAIVTLVAVLVPSRSVAYLQHHYDVERGDRKVPPPFSWRLFVSVGGYRLCRLCRLCPRR